MDEPGKRNRKISVRQQATTQDAIGQPVNTWTEVAKLWAEVTHRSGKQVMRADQDVSIVTVNFRVRRRTNITAAMRVWFAGKVYEIKAVIPDERDRESMDLLCEVING